MAEYKLPNSIYVLADFHETFIRETSDVKKLYLTSTHILSITMSKNQLN